MPFRIRKTPGRQDARVRTWLNGPGWAFLAFRALKTEQHVRLGRRAVFRSRFVTRYSSRRGPAPFAARKPSADRSGFNPPLRERVPPQLTAAPSGGGVVSLTEDCGAMGPIAAVLRAGRGGDSRNERRTGRVAALLPGARFSAEVVDPLAQHLPDLAVYSARSHSFDPDITFTIATFTSRPLARVAFDKLTTLHGRLRRAELGPL